MTTYNLSLIVGGVLMLIATGMDNKMLKAKLILLMIATSLCWLGLYILMRTLTVSLPPPHDYVWISGYYWMVTAMLISSYAPLMFILIRRFVICLRAPKAS